MVEAVAVVVEAGFGVKVFRREAVAEAVCERASLGDELAKGIVCVDGYCVARGIKIARDIAVCIVAGDIGCAIYG